MTSTGRPLTVHCSGPVPLTPATDALEPLRPGIIHAWFCRTHEVRDRLLRYEGWMDAEERARAERFRFEADRERFLTAHGLLRQILGAQLRIPPDRVPLSRGRHGKPFVAGTRLRFNMSDTKDAVLIAITLDHEIGADVETLHRRVDHASVADHFFTPEEVRWIGDGETDPDGDPVIKRRFLELWTRKEAVLKASGVGIMEDLRSLRSDAAVNRMIIRHPEFIAMAAPEYHVRTHHVGESHILSVAMEAPWDHLFLMHG